MSQMQEGEQEKKMKGWLSWCWVLLQIVVTIAMFFLDPLVELIVLGTYIVYDLLYFGFPGWFPEQYRVPILNISHFVSDGMVGISLVFAVSCLLVTLSRMGWRSSRMPFFSPAVFTWLASIGLAYAAISHLGLISIIAQWLILLWYCAICVRSKSKPSMVARKAMEAPLSKNLVCSICQQPSVNDPCLSCEGKYRGEVQRIQTQNLRAQLVGAPATLTLKEWLTTLDHFHWHCAYCQQGPFEAMEHYIPLPDPKGGTTAENCVPACHKCNLKKSNKHPEKIK